MTPDMLMGIIVGILIGTSINIAASKRHRKKDFKERLEDVDLTEEQRRAIEKFLKAPLPSKYDGIGKVLADDVLERQGLKEPQWPEGTPNPNIVAPPYDVVKEK